MKKTILAISTIAMITSNLFAVADTPASTISSKLSSNWVMDGKKMSGAFPIRDVKTLTKAHGGNLSPITAYSDGMGVKVVSSTSMLGSAINNSAYNKLVFKYGEASKASGLSLADQVLTGTNKVVPSVKDIKQANKIKADEDLENQILENTATIKCSLENSLTRAELDQKIANNEDLRYVCTSGITDMSNLFYENTTFNQDISRWDTSHVTNMYSVFNRASTFNQPIGNWDVSHVTNVRGMFYKAYKFNQPIGNWNVSNVTNFGAMFYAARVFNQPIGNWDMGKATDISFMFAWDNPFNQPIGNWNVSNVTRINHIFEGTHFNQDISNWDTGNNTDMTHMFWKTPDFNQDLSKWNTSNVTNMFEVFRESPRFNQDISKWDTSNVTNMHAMFYEATDFDQNISNWNVSNVTSFDSFAGKTPIDGTSKSPF